MGRFYLYGVVDKWEEKRFVVKDENENRPLAIFTDHELQRLFDDWKKEREELNQAFPQKVENEN